MKSDQIRVGMILRLKKDVLDTSAHADGTPLTSDLITVTAIRYRNGYLTPWIMAGMDAFKPSNFARAV